MSSTVRRSILVDFGDEGGEEIESRERAPVLDARRGH